MPAWVAVPSDFTLRSAGVSGGGAAIASGRNQVPHKGRQPRSILRVVSFLFPLPIRYPLRVGGCLIYFLNLTPSRVLLVIDSCRIPLGDSLCLYSCSAVVGRAMKRRVTLATREKMICREQDCPIISNYQPVHSK